jgi:hypothetical protein
VLAPALVALRLMLVPEAEAVTKEELELMTLARADANELVVLPELYAVEYCVPFTVTQIVPESYTVGPALLPPVMAAPETETENEGCENVADWLVDEPEDNE